MKKILIVTSYYPPEIGAASNRIKHMAEGLHNLGYDITVITPLPNYPTGIIFNDFKGKLIDKTNLNGVKVVRLWIYPSVSKNKLKRLFAMCSYSLSLTLFYLFDKVPNTVIVQCSPLIVGFTSMLWLKSKRRKLILNISDLWPKAGLELGALKEGRLVNVLRRIERFNYRRAHLIMGQSNEILNHVKSIIPDKRTFLYRNYPIIEKRKLNNQKSTIDGKLKLVYAGLLGVAQGVHDICKYLDYDRVEFHIYGDGAEKLQIKRFSEANNDLPIYYHGSLKREELHKELIKFDLALIPLKKSIYGSVPSKIFEYAILGLPVLYFGGGEGEVIILEHKLGYVAEAGNYSELNNVILKIDKKDISNLLRAKIKKTAEDNFQFDTQLKEFNQLIQ